MRFEFATSMRIIFGTGSASEAAPLASFLGKKAFVITGKNPKRAETLLKQLHEKGVKTALFSVHGEPTTHIVLRGVKEAKKAKSEIVISIGGGSVIDAGKAISALLTNPGELFDYLEVIGKAKPIQNHPAPFIAIPTTAGTGAEVTKNAVLLSPEHKVKVSMRNPMMIPRIALVDPVLTYSMPPEITASTGLDALTQLIEPFVSQNANPLTDGICREGLVRAARSLKKAFLDGSDRAAREDMALASLFGGLALANAKLGAAHGFAGPLGGMFNAPHGVICARLLPFVMETNVNALLSRSPDSPVLSRYEELARILTNNSEAQVIDAVEWIRDLCSVLKVPPLSQVGVKKEDFPKVVQKAQNSSSMKGNPIPLTEKELMDILEGAT